MAQRPLYRTCPSWLIDHCEVGPLSTVVDLGCGSGSLIQVLLDRFPDARELRIFGLDPSGPELRIARERITDERVTFLEARAHETGALADAPDVVFLCNVIHQIPLRERAALCRSCFELLAPSGRFALNTLFYAGGIPRETRAFYFLWIRAALAYLERHGLQPDIPAEKPVALQLLDPGQHRALLSTAGFRDVVVEESFLDWQVEDWEALSHYSVFIRGALGPGVDFEIGSAALRAGVRTAFERLGLDSVRRGWLHLAGRKPASR